MRLIQIVPKEHFRLYGALIAKEVELRKRKQGTFRRTALKQKNYAKWKHKSYYGWPWLREVVTVELQSRAAEDGEWQLLHAFLGFVDRHFADEIQSIQIQYL